MAGRAHRGAVGCCCQNGAPLFHAPCQTTSRPRPFNPFVSFAYGIPASPGCNTRWVDWEKTPQSHRSLHMSRFAVNGVHRTTAFSRPLMHCGTAAYRPTMPAPFAPMAPLMHMHSDVLIVAPASGPSLAISWQKRALPPPCCIRTPPPRWAACADGREIALTHPAWPPAAPGFVAAWPSEMGHIRAAHVHDGPVGAQRMQLRWRWRWRPRHRCHWASSCPTALRRTAYGVAASHAGRAHRARCAKCTGWPPCPRAEVDYTDAAAPPDQPAPVRTAGGGGRQPLFCRTPPAGHWRQMMTDFGRTVIVCHAPREPADTAHECFYWLQTRCGAALPDDAAGHPQCSVVVTAQAADATPDGAGAHRIHGRGAGAVPAPAGRHGADRTAAPRWSPCTRSLHRPRCALLGDAAVGMHPVTAHGFHNLGLAGGGRLTQALEAARQRRAGPGRRRRAGALCPRPPPAHAWPYLGHQRHRAAVPTPPLPACCGKRCCRRAAPAAAQGGHRGTLTGKTPAWQTPLARLGTALAAARPGAEGLAGPRRAKSRLR